VASTRGKDVIGKPRQTARYLEPSCSISARDWFLGPGDIFVDRVIRVQGVAIHAGSRNNREQDSRGRTQSVPWTTGAADRYRTVKIAFAPRSRKGLTVI
jgi:hypothetical protein